MKLFKNADKRIVSSGIAIGIATVIAYCLVSNFSRAFAWLKDVLSLFSTVTWGLVLAYVLKPFANFFERVLPKKIKNEKTRVHIGSVCAVLLFIVILAVFIGTILPQLVMSGKAFVNNFDGYLESVKGTIAGFADRFDFVEFDVDKIIGSSNEVLKAAGKWVSENIDIFANYAVELSGKLFNFIITIAMAAYALVDRKNLMNGTRRVERALFGAEKTLRINTVVARGDKLMMSFLGSNLLDALIIGVANFIFLGIVKAPYQIVLAVMLGVTNFIPTFGPIIGGVAGGTIVLLTKPSLLLGFIIFTVIIQQIDGNVIKPLLFGDSTGLSPFWVLVAIVVGGNLFGVPGMVLGVPVVALIASLIKETLDEKEGIGGEKPLETPKSRIANLKQKRISKRKS